MGDLTPEHLTKEINKFECTNLGGGSILVRVGQNTNLM